MKNISLEDLKRDQCRWPIGDPKNDDFGFCGAKKSGKVYCKKHNAIAYIKRRNVSLIGGGE
jgi:GcrA cell cycle regulator